MIHNILIFVCCFCTTLTCLFSSNQPVLGNVSRINWQTDYESAFSQAKNSSKPLLLFFTWSEGCPYCTKLEKEALNTPEFIAKVADKFIFVRLDYSESSDQLKQQHDQLQKKYNIKGYPTIIIFDAKQNRQIGTTGYRPGRGQQYADHLLQFISTYSTYKQSIDQINNPALDGKDLKAVYQVAKKLQFDNDISKIIQRGLSSNESTFFLLENYRYMAYEGKIRTKEALELREKLLALDLNNQKSIPYEIAVIDFETYSAEMDKNHSSPELAIAPLIAYIEKYGAQDKANLWKLQIIISQVYLDRNQLDQALKYAQDCYESAPFAAQANIARAIQSIRLQVDNILLHTHSS